MECLFYSTSTVLVYTCFTMLKYLPQPVSVYATLIVVFVSIVFLEKQDNLVPSQNAYFNSKVSCQG